MLSNIEKFVAGEIVISLENNEVNVFFEKMYMMGFDSISEYNEIDVIKKNNRNLVVQYLPNLGFRFINLNELKSELNDIISEDVKIMKLKDVFNIVVPSVA